MRIHVETYREYHQIIRQYKQSDYLLFEMNPKHQNDGFSIRVSKIPKISIDDIIYCPILL